MRGFGYLGWSLLVIVSFKMSAQPYKNREQKSGASVIINQYKDHIPDAIVEDVIIYSKESSCSDKVIERKARLVRYQGAEGTVVICHGFMCSKDQVAFLRRVFPRGRFNVLTFDFRAHGDLTQGQHCTFGRDEVNDVVAAVDYVKNHKDLQGLPVFGYGFSMGAATAIEAQAQDGALFKAMILDCPFASTEEIIGRGLEGVKISILGYECILPGQSVLQRYAFHPHVQAFVKNVLRCVTHLDPRKVNVNFCRVYPAESIKKIWIPCCIIHCKHDEKISVDSIKNIYGNCASSYKQLWITEGAGHFGSFFHEPERYTKHVRDFLEEVLNGTAYREEKKEIVEDK